MGILKNIWSKLTISEKKTLLGSVFAVMIFSALGGFGFGKIKNGEPNTKVTTNTDDLRDDIELIENNDDENYSLLTIVVQEGDTLTSLANKYNTTISEISKLNNIENEDLIYPGTKLKINTDTNTIEKVDHEIPENKVEYVPRDTTSWQEDLEKYGFVKGIDISFYQSHMDLDNVLKQNDIKFVMSRMAYFWGNENIDKEFYNQAQICKDNNVALGIYFWPTFKNIEVAEKELNTILNTLEDLRVNNDIYLDMPICLDIELPKDGGGDLVKRIKNNDKQTIDAIQYTINRLSEEGYYTMIYCSDNVSQEIGLQLKDFNLDIWISKYYTNKSISFSDNDAIVQESKYAGMSTMRQYTQSGKVVGYSDYVDLDLCYYNLPQIIKNNNLNYHKNTKTLKLY